MACLADWQPRYRFEALAACCSLCCCLALQSRCHGSPEFQGWKFGLWRNRLIARQCLRPPMRRTQADFSTVLPLWCCLALRGLVTRLEKQRSLRAARSPLREKTACNPSVFRALAKNAVPVATPHAAATTVRDAKHSLGLCQQPLGTPQKSQQLGAPWFCVVPALTAGALFAAHVAA